jgi:hypothetical protein
MAKCIVAAIIFTLAGMAGFAQSAGTTTVCGTSGALPVFTSGRDIENSVITQSKGNIRIPDSVLVGDLGQAYRAFWGTRRIGNLIVGSSPSGQEPSASVFADGEWVQRNRL